VPTYQYACTECGHAFEEVQSFSDDALTVCPECAGKLRKLFNAVGVVFKGSGFYRNDSRAKESSSLTSSASSETKSETKSETTSAPKTETKSSDSAGKTPAASTSGSTS